MDENSGNSAKVPASVSAPVKDPVKDPVTDVASGPLPETVSDPVSAAVPDWSRERIERFWEPGKKLIRAVRRYQHWQGRGLPGRLMSKYWVLNHWFWSLMTQSELHLTTQIGGGLRLTHPTGIIVHPEARIGPNCMIFHQVTLAGRVVLGGHVDVGAGARLIGPLTVGDHVVIGANAVVTRDVPAGVTVAGVPARIISRGDPQA